MKSLRVTKSVKKTKFEKSWGNCNQKNVSGKNNSQNM